MSSAGRTSRSALREPKSSIGVLEEPAFLSNGVRITNRLVKVAMEEGIGWAGGLPGAEHRRLYRRWGEGGWGVVITGNVQVDPRHLATTHDLTVSSSPDETVSAYNKLHRSITSSPTTPPLGIVQLSHPGLQSHILTFSSPFTRPVSSISARPTLGSSLYANFIAFVLYPRKAKVLDVYGWLDVVRRFVHCAELMEKAGWDGVQVHSAHGYLLAAYLSPLTNPDPVPLPGAPQNVSLRLHLLYLILNGIDQHTHDHFVLALKLNCSDFVRGGVDEETATRYIQEIVSWGVVHILEISGGTYANPAFANPSAYLETKPSPRQSMFSHFASTLRQLIPAPGQGGPLILLTGGLNSRPLIADSLNSACDLAGIGRAACVDPSFARKMLDPSIPDEEARMVYRIPGGSSTIRILAAGGSGEGIPLIGAGVATLWHEWQMARMGRGLEPDLRMKWGIISVLVEVLWYGLLRWLWALAVGSRDN